MDASATATRYVGGNVYVISNITISGTTTYRLNPTFDLLDVSVPDTKLTVADVYAGGGTETVTFNSAVIRARCTVGLAATWQSTCLILQNPTVFAGQTVTLVTNTPSTKLSLTNTLSIALNGNADLLSYTNFVAFTNTASASSFINNCTFDGKGLWGKAKDNSAGIDVVMTNNLGGLNLGQILTFGSSSPSGYVAFNALASGTVYRVTLDLLTPGSANDVMTGLMTNPTFTNFMVSDVGNGKVAFNFTASADGTLYYAWQNIGDNVEGIGLMFPRPRGFTLIVR